jgi:hypothetical protein
MDIFMRARFHLLVWVVILVVVPASPAQVKPTCQTSLAPSARAVLASNYADWRPKDISDLGTDDKQLWLNDHPNECPGIAVGHFEEADRLSYAVLLVPKLELKHGYKILVLTPTGDGCAVRILDHADGEYSSSGLVISKAAPGTYSDFEDTASVRVTRDAINVEWIEKAGVLYYWANGKFRTIQTSD